MRATPENTHLLLDRIAGNDEVAFEHLFRMYGKKLYNFSVVLVQNGQLAEEIVSDVFVKLWQGRKRLRQIRNIETYLFIAVKNQSYSYLSSQKNSRLVSIDDAAIVHAGTDPDPQTELELAELRSDIEFAVRNLPTNCQLVYRLIREDDFRYKQVAEIMDISVKTVENHFLRALKKLESALELHLEGRKLRKTH